ncbi:MAG: hypothetical protein Q8R60_04570 [Mycobacteriales bacterium]|nr:hypothetical protein [Mycobacteriales bacterium]
MTAVGGAWWGERVVTNTSAGALREPVAIGARNCLEDTGGRPAFSIAQGTPFKAGTAVVGRTLLATNLGTSVSQRVELRVQ